MLCDTADKAWKQLRQPAEDQAKVTAIVAADTLVWQTFVSRLCCLSRAWSGSGTLTPLRAAHPTRLSQASVLVPGFVINMIVRTTRGGVRLAKLSSDSVAARWLPTAVGLGAIPLIVHPIDHGVHAVMDTTTRPVMERFCNVRLRSSHGHPPASPPGDTEGSE